MKAFKVQTTLKRGLSRKKRKVDKTRETSIWRTIYSWKTASVLSHSMPDMQATKPKKIRSCSHCHQKEYQAQLVENVQMWVRVHPLIQHGSGCKAKACNSLKSCNLKTCEIILAILTNTDHPLEVQQSAEAKETKRKTKEDQKKEKEDRKKQKKSQKLQYPHFTEFKKANELSVSKG
jgi:hypothetical protein